MSDARKSIHQLKVEHDAGREHHSKMFHHKASGEDYQLLHCAFDEATNEKQAVYVLSSMPWLKFVRPWDVFLERFEAGPSVAFPTGGE